MTEEHKSLNEIIRFRREKLDTLMEKGVDPYPHNYDPIHTSSEVLAKYDELEGKDVTISSAVFSPFGI